MQLPLRFCILLFLLPILTHAQDSLYTRAGTVIPGYETIVKQFRVSYRAFPDSAAVIVPARDIYFVRYADGHTWPDRITPYKEARFRHYAMVHDGTWRDYKKQFAARASHRLLFTAPGLHSVDGYPGISIGLAYDGSLDRQGLFSIGLSLTRLWAGTNAAGKLSNNERRTNIRSTQITPAFRFHPLGKLRVIDPFAGIAVGFGSYREAEDIMVDNQRYGILRRQTSVLAPQLELGVNLNAGKSFTFQIIGAAGPQYFADKHQNTIVSLGLLRFGWRF